jgi:predicted RNA-binding Zn-ribbon protein involved in translation (DUF1610 family)
MDLGAELQKIYDSEINIRISWLWDGGIDVRLGDDFNGFVAEENVPSVWAILPWLQTAIAHFYTSSTYATALPSEVRESAARMIFRKSTTGIQVDCPYCGAPHAAPPGMEQLIQFICPRCGNSVEVEPPKIQ